MNEQTSKLIEQLAQKLGTTTEYLWSILLKQAFINSSIMLFQFLLIAIFGIVLFKIHRHLSIRKDWDSDGYNETGYRHYGDFSELIMFLIFVVFLIFVIIAFCSIDNLLNGFFNPEYWALNKILETIQ